MCLSLMSGNLTSGGGNMFDVFTEDPNSMPGQGLARTDNYRTATANRDYNAMLDTLLSTENQDQILAAEQRYRPEYIDLDTAGTGRTMNANLDLVRQYMPEIEATRRASDPASAQLLDMMLAQATNEVAAGGSLTPDQQRMAEQNSRAAFAARGLSGSNLSVADELLSELNLSESLKGQRRAFAANTLGLNQDLRRGFTPQDWLSFAQGTSRTAGSTLLPAGAQVGLLNNVYGENQQNNRVQAGLETQLGMHQADIWNDWGKTFAGGAMACWAAREVFGVQNSKWLQFRHWLLNRAPEKLRAWYLENGEAWAERLRTNPLAKQVVRRWMERRIATLANT